MDIIVNLRDTITEHVKIELGDETIPDFSSMGATIEEGYKDGVFEYDFVGIDKHIVVKSHDFSHIDAGTGKDHVILYVNSWHADKTEFAHLLASSYVKFNDVPYVFKKKRTRLHAIDMKVYERLLLCNDVNYIRRSFILPIHPDPNNIDESVFDSDEFRYVERMGNLAFMIDSYTCFSDEQKQTVKDNWWMLRSVIEIELSHKIKQSIRIL
jgi:hypothetical protein